jgi:RHS repeat-associated protein
VVSWTGSAWDELHPRNSSNFRVRHLFQGQLWTPETGLNDYRNRVELPTMGVFLQPDPIGFKGDAANIYRFCNNNAVNRSDPMGLVDTSASIWNRLAYMEGGSSLSFAEFDKQRQGLNDMTINQLGKQLVGSKDTTTAIVPTKDGLEVTDAATEVKVPRSGDPTGAFGYSRAEEHFNLRSDALRTIHAHTREAREAALPSKKEDYGAVQQSKGKPMYFTSRYLARHGADPDGKKGNYIILHFTGPRPLDTPRLEYRFDPRLIPPPLPGE